MKELKVTAFKAGDVVELKSGGPDMTIARIIPPGERRAEEACCTWFDGTEVKSRNFEVSSLKSIEDRPTN